MISNPTIIKKNDETQQFHTLDINSFLIEEKVVLIEGQITAQVAEILDMIFLSYQSTLKNGDRVLIMMTNVECLEFRYVFTLYESIKELMKRGVEFNIQINGTITELAVLLALMDVPKYMSESSLIQIRELKIDNSFSQNEVKRLQAVDLIAHLEYYERLEKNYFTLLSKETGISYDEVFKMHERIKTFGKQELEELGIKFVNS
jgi:hypothetical protein